MFFTVLYRNPINKVDSPEFINFVTNFDNLYQKIVAEKPYSVFFTGDFNAKSLRWWSEGASDDEGNQLDNLFTPTLICLQSFPNLLIFVITASPPA